jgi:phage-related protein
MSAHLSVATAIEKNRIASDVAFVLLLDIAVTDDNGALVETLHLAKNSENIIYQGNQYTGANFDVKLDLDVDTEPKMVVSAEDPSGFLRERMEAYSGGVGFQVGLTVVNTGNLAQPPEMKESFEVTEAAASGYNVNFTLGIPSPVRLRFPTRLQFRDQCPFLYKGAQCAYAGSNPSCDFTYFGSNGCKAHNNEANFGGFLGLQNLGF